MSIIHVMNHCILCNKLYDTGDILDPTPYQYKNNIVQEIPNAHLSFGSGHGQEDKIEGTEGICPTCCREFDKKDSILILGVDNTLEELQTVTLATANLMHSILLKRDKFKILFPYITGKPRYVLIQQSNLDLLIQGLDNKEVRV